ncbi:MAG TPA: hypothetical protein DCP90_04485 [Clostridiales bacterium]|nr:MAG: hypothetical protein A2Y22_06780 [Clostridiales bacterium GWD2_32_59]HAN09853.1 hypothetical protein [Clostridiales bacterium]
MLNSFLKLFYKPEEVILEKLEPKVRWGHIGFFILWVISLPVAILLFNIINIILNMSQGINTFMLGFWMSQMFGTLLGTIAGAALWLILSTICIKLLGFIVGGKATMNEIAISQIYVTIPVIAVSIITIIITFLNYSTDGILSNILQMLENIMYVLTAIYSIYLEVRVVSALQRINLIKAIVNCSVFIVLAILTAIKYGQIVINVYNNTMK